MGNPILRRVRGGVPDDALGDDARARQCAVRHPYRPTLRPSGTLHPEIHHPSILRSPMSDATTNLLLPWILAAQAQKHVTHNEALRLLDNLVQLSVLDLDLTAPPGSPADGDRYIVASGATGGWAVLCHTISCATTVKWNGEFHPMNCQTHIPRPDRGLRGRQTIATRLRPFAAPRKSRRTSCNTPDRGRDGSGQSSAAGSAPDQA